MMRILKRLDIFILKNFLMMFAATFVICLFVVVMEFLFRYVDELIGKGLSMWILMQFLYYSAKTLIPLAVPLAVLLASLISFGNMGERLELLSMKAAGIPLLRILRPLVVVNIILSGWLFYYQDNDMPQAQLDLSQLLYSMRTKSPELDIPEGVFYDGIAGVNMHVKKKDVDTGMLYGVTIYNFKEGVNNAHIILCDSGRMVTSYDKTCIVLHLYNGEQFENMNNSAFQTQNVPYRRETFVQKDFIIDVDQNFNLADADVFSGNANVKNFSQIISDIDSMKCANDSVGRAHYGDLLCSGLYFPNSTKSYRKNYDNGRTEQIPNDVKHVDNDTLDIDRQFAQLPLAKQQQSVFAAMQKAQLMRMDTEYRGVIMEEANRNVRRHCISLWQKVTISLACLLFFFVGAPLGAIIRKGGLGMPIVVAVCIFLFYNMLGTSGMKVSREGSIPVWFGIWMSSIVMAPMGAWLTLKSNSDSAVFNKDAYASFFRSLMGIRGHRHVVRKEVIINDPDYVQAAVVMQELMSLCSAYLKQVPRRPSPFGYILYIFHRPDLALPIKIHETLEALVSELSNSKDHRILQLINEFPIMQPENFRFYRRRRRDMKDIIKYAGQLLAKMEEMNGGAAHLRSDVSGLQELD